MIKRVMSCYDRYRDNLINELEISDSLIEQIKSVFVVNSEDPMYDSFQIMSKHKIAIEKIINIKLDLSMYDYFIETYEN